MKFKCPTCGEVRETDGETHPPEFPFCSDRCRMVDLGKWLNEEYYISGRPASPEETDDEGI